MIRMIWIACAVIGCGDGVDPAWQLDHDRIIAIRSTPPRIAGGETARLDALLGYKGAPPGEADPDTAEVVSPVALAAIVARDADGWRVTFPDDEAVLAAARSELQIAAGEPVPVRVRVAFTAQALVGYKIVWLGERATNPILDPITIDGADARAQAQLTVAPAADIPLAVDFDDTYNVNWLTSCGTMHDFDLPRAYLRVEPEDPQSGTLAVVVRDERGGVAWQQWPITAE